MQPYYLQVLLCYWLYVWAAGIVFALAIGLTHLRQTRARHGWRRNTQARRHRQIPRQPTSPQPARRPRLTPLELRLIQCRQKRMYLSAILGKPQR